MDKKKRKVLLIGMDGLMPEQVEKYSNDIPELKKMLEQGFFAPAYSSPYTCTATNWPTIATGAWVGTHGCTSFEAHLPGMELGETARTFNSHLCRAEYFWHSAERQGKRSILINYPCAFPKLLRNGAVVGGDGLSSAQWTVRGPDLWQSHPVEKYNNSLLRPNRIILKDPGRWHDLPEGYEVLSEGIVGIDKQNSFTWTAAGIQEDREAKQDINSNFGYRFILIFKHNGSVKAAISSSRDYNDIIATLSEGSWSGWVYEKFNGSRCLRQYKMIELANDGSRVMIYGTTAAAASGWAYPEGLEKDVIDAAGGYVEALELEGAGLLANGNFDDMFFEIMQLQADWMVKCSSMLDKKTAWDTMWLQYHAPDGVNHAFLGDLYSEDEAKRRRADRIFRRMLDLLFKMASKIIGNCADEDTVVCIVSDHGNIPKTHMILTDVMLYNKGLLKFRDEQPGTERVIDTKNSKACSGSHGIWINLKGRQKYGCVGPGREYESLRSDIIEFLYGMRVPGTNECPFALVGRREDFAGMGISGDRVEDVICFPKTDYMNMAQHITGGHGYTIHDDYFTSGEEVPTLKDVIDHKMIWELTAIHWGLPEAAREGSSNRPVVILSGAGIKKGAVGKKRVNLVDVAPTLSYVLDIKPPENSEGRILWEAFE